MKTLSQNHKKEEMKDFLGILLDGKDENKQKEEQEKDEYKAEGN